MVLRILQHHSKLLGFSFGSYNSNESNAVHFPLVRAIAVMQWLFVFDSIMETVGPHNL